MPSERPESEAAESRASTAESRARPAAPPPPQRPALGGSAHHHQQLAAKRTLAPVERTVISVSLIRKQLREEGEAEGAAAAVASGGGSGGSGAAAGGGEVELAAATTLSLSFCNIFRISNLQGLERLTKLQLDNNVIERIEGLEHLVNLRWLDLSFNNIEKIEGLARLTQLTDLSLCDNRIAQLEGLEAQRGLEVLSLANNRLRGVDQLRKLRGFKQLRVLCLKGNPLCDEDDYQVTLLAFAPQIRYLDYARVDPEDARRARDRLMDHVLEQEEDEKATQAVEAEEARAQKRRAQLAAANLEGVDDLLSVIIKEDSEFPKLKALPGFAKILDDYRDMFTRTLGDFTSTMLQRHEAKCEQRRLLEAAVAEALRRSEERSKRAIAAFDASRKRAFALWEDAVAAGAPNPELLRVLERELAALVDELMEAEALACEQVGELLGEFETRYAALAAGSVNVVQGIFRSLEDVANSYVEMLQALVQQLLARFQNDEVDRDPELAALLADREVVKNAVTTSHDNHLSRIVAQADALQEREDAEAKGAVRRAREAEHERGRRRVAEIFDAQERYVRMIHEKEAIARARR